MVSLHLVNVQCLSIHPRTMSTNFAPNLSEASSPWCRPVVKASLERMPAMLLKPKTDVAMLRRPCAAKCGRTLTSSVHQLQLYPTSVYFSDFVTIQVVLGPHSTGRAHLQLQPIWPCRFGSFFEVRKTVSKAETKRARSLPLK